MKNPVDTPTDETERSPKVPHSAGSKSLGAAIPPSNDGPTSGRRSGYRDRPTDDGMHGDAAAEQAGNLPQP
jgi:hypothetical protein